MMALLVGVLAQTCVSMLPAPGSTIEWFRDGRPFARDVPVSATSTSRVFRRELSGGRSVQRVVSCGTSGSHAWLLDEVRGSPPVRLPITLDMGSTASIGGASIRRIEAPADAGRMPRGSAWFTVSSPGVTVYGVSPAVGIVETRTPAPAGGFSILRAVRREGAAPDSSIAGQPDREAQRRVLLERIGYLEITQLSLRDSIALLNARLDSVRAVPYSPTTVVELIAVDVYVERGEYDAALELLQGVERRLRAWSDSTGTRHRALDAIDARIRSVLSACADAALRYQPGMRPVSCAPRGRP